MDFEKCQFSAKSTCDNIVANAAQPHLKGREAATAATGFNKVCVQYVCKMLQLVMICGALSQAIDARIWGNGRKLHI